MLSGYLTQSDPVEEQRDELALLPQIEPWGATFRRNLKDFLLFRDWPRPFPQRRYDGWRTNYVNTAPAWSHIRESWHGHLFVIVAGIGLLTSSLFLRTPKLESPFRHASIRYVPLSEYLPPMNTRQPGTKIAKADPVYAPQEIISVRPNPDNRRQTIITPPNIKLDHDVPLPNITMWTPEVVQAPVEVATAKPRLVFPYARPEAVEPAVDVSRLDARKRNPSLQANGVEPAADLNALKQRQRDLRSQGSAVEPTVNPDALRRPAGQMNMAQLTPQGVQPAPALPVAVQRATGLRGLHGEAVPPPPNASALGGSRSGRVGQIGAQPEAVPPPPSIAGLPGNATGKGSANIIALSINPADVRGPVTVPAGNRNGEFAAGPNGKPGASGTPESTAGGSSGNGSGAAKPSSGPEGIYVGPAPAGAPTSPVAGTSTTKPQPVEMAKVISSAMHPSLADIAKHAASAPASPAASTPSADDIIARKVFAGKRYYSLTLNMPNLTSATGSWVIRFAELQDAHDGIAIAAPVPMNKVDPAYPQELVRDRVEGTVALYAVIHSDGSVGEIRVLRSVDRLLDASAARALAGWKFQPGKKNGAAVDLEAVVEIPFHLRRLLP